MLMLIELNEKELNMIRYCVQNEIICFYNNETILDIIRDKQIKEYEKLFNKLNNKENFYVKNL